MPLALRCNVEPCSPPPPLVIMQSYTHLVLMYEHTAIILLTVFCDKFYMII